MVVQDLEQGICWRFWFGKWSVVTFKKLQHQERKKCVLTNSIGMTSKVWSPFIDISGSLPPRHNLRAAKAKKIFFFPGRRLFQGRFQKKIYWHQDLVTLHWAKAPKPFFSPEETFLQKFVGTDDTPPPPPPSSPAPQAPQHFGWFRRCLVIQVVYYTMSPRNTNLMKRTV